ncbi:MAG: helix-turn-helix transcriptional regulator [Clostridia bacterium]|nr:helix-turn-helix transcriptional regulator [Clostridia bacterium]
MNLYKAIETDSVKFRYSYIAKPNQDDFKMHTHQECELFYFMSGKGIFHVEGTDYPLKQGDIAIMDNSESHYIELDCNYPYERFVVHFDKQYISKIDSEGKLLKIIEGRVPGKDNLFRKEHFSSNLYLMLINNIIDGLDKNKIQAETNFFALMNELLVASPNQSHNTDISNSSLINKIINYILANLEKNFSLDDICNEFFISKPQLCRMFKSTMGATVGNYITVKRLSAAKKMLESGDNPTKVYLKCGYSDYTNFYRAYKKFYGDSPTGRKHS